MIVVHGYFRVQDKKQKKKKNVSNHTINVYVKIKSGELAEDIKVMGKLSKNALYIIR